MNTRRKAHTPEKATILFHGPGGTDRIVDVVPGKAYQVTGWIKITGKDGDPGGGGGIYCFVQTFEYKQLDATPNFVIAGSDGNGKKKIAAGEWTQFKINFTPPGKQIRLRVHKHEDDKYEALFDDFVLSEAP